jgi:hypothetical protein
MCVRTFISFSTFDSCRRQFCSRFAPYFTPTASTVVSGYGFLTFQNQTDADRILSAEHFIGRGGKQVRERRKKTSEKFAVRRSAVQYTVRRKGVSLRSWSLKESCEERKGSQGGYTAIYCYTLVNVVAGPIFVILTRWCHARFVCRAFVRCRSTFTRLYQKRR